MQTLISIYLEEYATCPGSRIKAEKRSCLRKLEQINMEYGGIIDNAGQTQFLSCFSTGKTCLSKYFESGFQAITKLIE